MMQTDSFRGPQERAERRKDVLPYPLRARRALQNDRSLRVPELPEHLSSASRRDSFRESASLGLP